MPIITLNGLCGGGSQEIGTLLAHCLNHSHRDKNSPATDNATRSDENDLNRIADI